MGYHTTGSAGFSRIKAAGIRDILFFSLGKRAQQLKLFHLHFDIRAQSPH